MHENFEVTDEQVASWVEPISYGEICAALRAAGQMELFHIFCWMRLSGARKNLTAVAMTATPSEVTVMLQALEAFRKLPPQPPVFQEKT